jgi:outer membrane protein assembly factor BamB
MQQFGGKQPGWGYSESVLVDGSRVLCTPGGPQGSVVALDKLTGDLLWQTKEFTEAAQYSSILPVDCGGRKQFVQVTLGNVAGFSAEDGSTIWQAKWAGKVAVIPKPVYHEGHIYLTSGYAAGCALLKIDTGGTPTELYKNGVMKNQHGGVVLCGGNIYGHSDASGWICQEFKTGRQVWAEKSKLGKGSLTCADGMLYCLDEASGNVALVEASPSKWQEHGRFRIGPQSAQRSPQGKIWTHPVVAHGRLFLRDQEVLLCYDVRRK